MIKKILSTGALALLFCGCAGLANAAFYLRPEVQFGFLADGHSDTDVGVGGALSWGGSFGKEQRYEVGVEFSHISYKGKFEYPYGSGMGGELRKISATCDVTPIQAAFRYTFITENKKVRPYVGMSLGYSWLDFDTTANTWGDFSSCWTGSLGGGVSYRLGRRTFVNLGYRYFFSDSAASHGGESLLGPFFYRFRYNAHVFSISINQLLGRLRK